MIRNAADTCGLEPMNATSVVCDEASATTQQAPVSGDNERDGLYIHPHWQQYIEIIDSAPDALIYGLGVFITIVCCVGITGNATAIFIFSRTPGLRTPSNLLVINLAASDFAFSFICGFPLMSIASFVKRWRWGDTGLLVSFQMPVCPCATVACQWYGFVAGLCGLNSINSLACISIDRYLVISRPLTMLHKATKLRSMQMICCTWLWALAWALPPMLGWGRYIGEGFQVSCTFDYLTRTTANIVYNYCLVGFEFVLPVGIIVLCYVGIICSVSRQTAAMSLLDASSRNKADRARQQQDKQAFEQEMKLAKIAAVMITLFVVSWLPYAIVAQLGVSGYTEYVTPYAAEFPVMLAKASAVWNPIVYSLSHPRYKAALAARLPAPLRNLCCRQETLKRTSATGTTRSTVTSGTGSQTRGGTEPSVDNDVSTQQELSAQTGSVSTLQFVSSGEVQSFDELPIESADINVSTTAL